MALEFTEQVTVRVWRNIKTAGFMPTSHFGHASVEVRAPYVGRDEKAQISYWPGSRQGAGKGMSGIRAQPHGTHASPGDDKKMEMNRWTALRLEVGYRQKHGIDYPPAWDEILIGMNKSPLTARAGQKPIKETWNLQELGDEPDPELDIEMPMWSQSPQQKIKLPALKCFKHNWGLSIPNMMQWWQKFQQTTPSYRALSTNRNCAGVALMALEAGGAGAFLPLPHVFIYAEPTQVEDYAIGLRSVIEQLEKATVALQADIASAKAKGLLKPVTGVQVNGLWTLEEWKKRSALGPLQPRSGTIREIDEGLDRYHTYIWAADYQKKFAAFVQVFRAIAKHRNAKADSARSGALLALADQAMTVLQGSGPMHHS